MKLYRWSISYLFYLTSNKYHILFGIYLWAWLENNHRESYFTLVKRIFRYLIDTTTLGISYQKSQDANLLKYCDSDFVGCKIDIKFSNAFIFIFKWIFYFLNLQEIKFYHTINYKGQVRFY